MTHAGDLSVDRQSDARESEDAGDRAWYLYGIVRAPHSSGGGETELANSLPSLTAAGVSVSLLPVGDLAAVVRPVRRSDFTEEALQTRLRDPATLEEMVRAHNEVITAIHEQRSILPAKLGGVYERLDDLEEALEDSAGSLRAQLDRVEGCDEWAIHIYAERAAVERDVATGHPTLRRLQDELSTASPGRAYFLQRKVANDLATATAQALEEVAQSAFELLRAQAVDGHASPAARSADTVEGEIEVLRAAFLVARATTERFAAAAESLNGSRPGVRCEYSGPWPPYSFAAEG